MKIYTFHVEGMRCPSCVVLTETELGRLKEISSVKVSLRRSSVELAGDFGDKSPEHIAKDLSLTLQPHGYRLFPARQKHRIDWSEFGIAVPAAGTIIGIFVLLQSFGIVNAVNITDVGYGAAFVIGLVASVSSCVAVVGSLVLSLSASFVKTDDRVWSSVSFHLGRFLSFFILGGLIGSLGAVFGLNQTAMSVLGLLVALVLLILGINLLDIFPWFRRLQIAVPGSLGRRVNNIRNLGYTLMPFFIGAATFFLPCGFTQSMQIYTLTTGSFLEGGLIMLLFALGTFPVLALLSFGFAGLRRRADFGVVFKIAGLVVIFFAVLNLANSLAAMGIIQPIFTF